MTATVSSIELARHDWEAFRVMGDRSAGVRESLAGLLAAESVEEAQSYYWRLENTVVVQGQLFEAALYVVPVLLAGLLDELSLGAHAAVLELLFQIVAGESDMEEAARGLPDLGERCRARAREGVWVLYREMFGGHAEAAVEVLEAIETDSERLLAFREATAAS